MGHAAQPLTIMVAPLLTTLYGLWSVAWLMVGYHYGKAAYASWRGAGGLWSNALAEVIQPFAWALRAAACRLPWLSRAEYCAAEEVPSNYTNGHLLRFAIFLGSLTPGLWGLFLAARTSRVFTPADLAVNALGLGISILAAASHLLLAYKSRPRAWSNVVAVSVAWVLIAPVALALLGVM